MVTALGEAFPYSLASESPRTLFKISPIPGPLPDPRTGISVAPGRSAFSLVDATAVQFETQKAKWSSCLPLCP